MTVPAPSDADVRRCLERGLRARGEQVGIVDLQRAPYPYATSFPLEDVSVWLNDGRVLRLILKDLTWERLLEDARRTKPRFLYDPRRCIGIYERVLPGTGFGAACYGSFVDDDAGRYWLLLEKVPGVELWQMGDLSTWEAVARWLARFHRTFAGSASGIGSENPSLLRYDAELLWVWPARAAEAVAASDRARLAPVLAGYERVVERLAAVPPTFVHGELYASNVLVSTGSGTALQVWPIDWEMAGLGPPLLDLAALTAGWDGPEQAKLVQAYADELGPEPWRFEGGDLDVLLDCCRLHYALQWLGWSAEWAPPAEHARDWVSEALAVGGRLRL